MAFARAGFSVVMIALALVGGCLRSAHARLGETLLDFGDELVKWQDFKAQSAPRRLNVNGLELGLLTQSTDLDVASALDRFQDFCRRRGGLAVPEALRRRLGARANAFDGVFRQESADKGVLACLDSGHPLTLSELEERLTRVNETGDIAALGELRYVLAKRSGARTTLLVFWADGAAPILQMFPKAGDAPGRDPRDVPRAPGGQRILFATEQGAPYTVASYRISSQGADQLRRWYRDVLTAGDWQVTSAQHGLLARRNGRSILVVVSTAASGGATATLAELE